jgi:hypothetical protein
MCDERTHRLQDLDNTKHLQLQKTAKTLRVNPHPAAAPAAVAAVGGGGGGGGGGGDGDDDDDDDDSYSGSSTESIQKSENVVNDTYRQHNMTCMFAVAGT